MKQKQQFKRTAFPLSAKSMVSTLLLLIAMLLPQGAWAANHYDAGYESTATTYSAAGIKFKITAVRMYNYQGNNSHFNSNPLVTITAGGHTHTFNLGSLTGESGKSIFYYNGEGNEDPYKGSGSFSKRTYEQTVDGIPVKAYFDNQKNEQGVSTNPDKTYKDNGGGSTKWCTADLTIEIGVQTAATVTIAGNWRDESDGINTTESYSWPFDIPKHTCNSDIQSDTYRKSAATCTAAAVYYESCSWCGAAQSGTFTSGSALGHGSTGYNESYSWTGNAYNDASKDTKACIFTLTCKKCSTKVVNGASLTCTKTAHVDATCTATGSTTYQATGSYTSSNSAYNYIATKTNVYTVAALGHGSTGYTESYVWTGNAYNNASQDTKACIFTLTCKKCSTKVVNGASLTCTKTAHVDASCTATGSTTYQATGSYTAANSAYNYSATKTNVYTVAALGHLWHDDRQDLCDRCNHTFLYYEHTGKTSLHVNGRYYNSKNEQVTAYHTYDNNTHIGTIEIYDIVVKIYDVFDWGSTVTSVKIPHTVKELHGTFYQCKGLNSVTLYEGLESISVNTFNKTPLSSITLPHSLKYIDGSAFQNCNNLTSLVMQSVPQIDGVWQSGRNTTETVVLAEDSYVYKDSNPNFPTVASVTAPCALDLTGSAVENHPNLIHTGGQKIVDVAAVAPTCTTDGHTEGTHCNLCDKPLTVQQTIPATGHSFNNKTLTAEAVEDALYVYVCDNGCGEQSDAHVIKDYDGAGNNLELTKEASGNYTAYSVAIEDGKSFSTPVPFITKNVMMNRSFTDGIPSTIMLPFSIDASDFGYETPGGEKLGNFFFKFQSVTRNAETGKWEAIMTRVTDVIAYTPYVIVMYKTSTLDFGWNYNTMTFSATPAASDMITTDAETGWTFVGLNETKRWEEGDQEIGKAYGIAGKDKDYDDYSVHRGDFVKIAAGASAKPGRCYLLKEGGILSNARGMTRAAEEEELPAVIQLRLVGSSTQGIGTINTETGEMTIEGWYDLNGNKIEEPSKGGVYIHNNKKVMLK